MISLFLLQQSVLPLSIELGVLGGLAVATVGYLQASSKVDAKGNKEKFNADKFVTTVFIGAVIGGILAFLGDIDGVFNMFLASAGAVAIVEALIKFTLNSK